VEIWEETDSGVVGDLMEDQKYLVVTWKKKIERRGK